MTKLPPIPEVDWQKPLETSANHHKLKNILNGFAINITQVTQGLKNTQLLDVARQKLPPKRIGPQISVTAKEQFRQSQTGNGFLPFLDLSNNLPTDIQKSDKHIMITVNGDNKNPFLTITTPHIEERLVKDEQNKKL